MMQMIVPKIDVLTDIPTIVAVESEGPWPKPEEVGDVIGELTS